MSRAISGPMSQTLLPMNRWFIWKETRQLVPLMIALVVAAAAVLVIRSEMLESWERVPPLTILVFPGLFAVGAGTVLVGQEREQRTMDWLTTLPIASRDLITVKIYVALVGLAMMWCLALLTIALTGLGHDRSNWLTASGSIVTQDFSPLIRYPMWIVHSVYVLLCSFLASWRIKNSFTAIIAVAPLACLPLLLCEAVLESVYLATGQHLKMSATYWVRLAVMLLSVPAMWMLARRTALAFLGPQSGPKYRITIERLTTAQQRSPRMLSNGPTFGSQVTSIIWQSFQSSRLLWTALFSMMMLGIYLPFFEISSGIRFRNGFWLDFFVFLSPLAVSWLGVSVFKNDGAPSQLQFLADRGIGSTKIYLGRHAIPMAIIACGLIAYTLTATHLSTHRTPNDAVERLPSMWAMTLVSAVIYSASQWTSQLIRMVVLAALIAPIVSILVLSWWSIAAGLGAPVWMLAAFALLPMLATWRMMPRYMDRRDRPRAILLGITVVFALFALPIIPQVWGLAMIIRSGEIPDIAQLAPLREEGLAAIEAAPPTVRLQVSYYRGAGATSPEHGQQILPEASIELWKRRATTPEDFLPTLNELRDQTASGATIPEQTWQALRGRLTLERVKFAEATESKRPDLVDEFGSWVDAASLIARRLRRSPKWFDQEVADRLEVWLVETLGSPELAPHRAAPFFVDAATRFVDAEQRRRSRMAGVLASWTSWRYPTLEERNSVVPKRDPLVDRLAEGYYTIGFGITAGDLETTAMVAIESLRSPAGSTNGISWERRMHDAVFSDRLPFELGPYAPRYRDLPDTTAIEGMIRYPARYWGLAWEGEADTLRLAAAKSGSSTQIDGDDQ